MFVFSLLDGSNHYSKMIALKGPDGTNVFESIAITVLSTVPRTFTGAWPIAFTESMYLYCLVFVQLVCDACLRSE